MDTTKADSGKVKVKVKETHLTGLAVTQKSVLVQQNEAMPPVNAKNNFLPFQKMMDGLEFRNQERRGSVDSTASEARSADILIREVPYVLLLPPYSLLPSSTFTIVTSHRMTKKSLYFLFRYTLNVRVRCHKDWEVELLKFVSGAGVWWPQVRCKGNVSGGYGLRNIAV